MDKLKEIDECEKIARIRLALIQKQHARAVKKLQKAEKTKWQDCRRRKTIHGYPPSLSSGVHVHDVGARLATISEENVNIAPEQLGGSQHSNVQRPRGCNSINKTIPKESQGDPCRDVNQNTDFECQHVPDKSLSEAQAQCKSKANDNNQTLDNTTSSDSKTDWAEGKNDVLNCRNVEVKNNLTKMISHSSMDTCNLKYDADDCVHLSTKPPIPTFNHSEDLLPVSVTSDNESIAKDSTDLECNNNEGRLVTKFRVFGQDQNMITDGENGSVQGCKDSIMRARTKSKASEFPKIIEKNQREMTEEKAVVNKHWLHLFEEPFPRRSPRIRKRPNYTETFHSHSFTESQDSFFSDKQFLECSPTKSKKHRFPFDNKVTNLVDNWEYSSTVCTSNTVNLTQDECLDTNQKKLVNKPEGDSKPDRLGISGNSRAVNYNSHKKLGKKRKGRPSDSCKSKKRLDSVAAENSAPPDLLTRSESNNASECSFPKPTQDFTKPGGPLSIIVDFSLPDKEFAKLKLQKIKNSNMKVKGDNSKSTPGDAGSLSPKMMESLCSAEDSEADAKRVILKPKHDEAAGLSAVNLDRGDTEFKSLMEIDTDSHESSEVDQRQRSTEPTIKQHNNQRDILGKQKRNSEDVGKAFEVSLTFPSAAESCGTNSSHKCGSVDNLGNQPSDQVTLKASHLDEACLKSQNTCLQSDARMDLGADQNVERKLPACRTGGHVQQLETFQHTNHLEQSTADISDPGNLPSPSDHLISESPAKEVNTAGLFSTCYSQVEIARTPESPKRNTLNPQEPCVGSEVTPFGKGDIPQDSSSAAGFSREVAGSSDRSGTVPVLMQACLQHSFPGCGNEVRCLSMSSYELPAAGGEELRRKRDVMAVCLAHTIVVWGAQSSQQWQVLHTWKVDVSEEFLEAQFARFKSDLVLISGGNFTKGNTRVYCNSEDGEFTLELKQEKVYTSSLFNAMCQLEYQSQIPEQEGFLLFVACAASSQQVVTKWTLDSQCLTVQDEETLPVTNEVRQILSLCAVDGSDTILLGTTRTSLLIWNVKKVILMKKISFQDVDIPTPCCLKALSYKGLILLTLARGHDQDGKTVIESSGKDQATSTSRCCLLAVNPVTTKMVTLLHFSVASDLSATQGVVGTSGHYIAVGCDGGGVCLWNMAWPSCSIELPVFHDKASSICFHPYRPVTAFGSISGCVHVYSLG